MRKNAFVCTAAIAALTVAVISSLLIACGHKRAQVTQLSLEPPSVEQPAEGQESGSGVLPGVMALDGCITASRGVSEDETVTSQGWEAYINDQTGTTSDREYSIEPSGTGLNLRAYASGDYAYAVYGQLCAFGGGQDDDIPLRTFVDCGPPVYGGSGSKRDDDIQLSYFVGAADYSLGSWRWFGPFSEEVTVTVNSETLRSRFKSPNGNFYLCVLAANGSKAASALPEHGVVAKLPFETATRSVMEEEDPGGILIEAVITDVGLGQGTEPAVVTGLSANATTAGVTLSWDKNPDPDVDIYQIFRRDADIEEPREIIATVFTPDTDLTDSIDDPMYPIFNWEVGISGKRYRYSVRARNNAGYGGYSIVSGIRLMRAPVVTATDGAYNDHIHVTWTAVEGAEGYALLRGDTPEEAPVELGQFGAETLSYDDYDCVLEQVYYYWVRALGEDADSSLGGPEPGLTAELEANQVLATDGAYPDRVELVWGEDPLANSYYVYRDTDEVMGGEEFLGTVDAPQCAFSDDTAPWDEPRFYFVRPFTIDEGDPGIGDWGHRGLAAPANVTASQGTFVGKVAVSWSAVNNATRYRVYRSVSADDPDPAYLDEVEAPATVYDDTTAAWGDTEGVHYFYFVTALHDGPDEEHSGYSAGAEGWRGIGIPANVSASDGTNTTGVNVSWAAVTGATHYRIYRSVIEDDPAPTLLTTIAAPSSGYSDTTTSHDTLYWYSVSAVYNGDEGARSADESGYRGLEPPLNVQASDDLPDTIEITWSAVTGATGYIVYRSNTELGTYTQIGTDTESPYTDGPFAPETTRWYKLKATNSLATSAFSAGDEGTASFPEWHIVTADEVGDVGTNSFLAVVNGHPAIAYRDQENTDLKYVRANDAMGSNWGVPETLDSGTSVLGAWASLALVHGNPAISYYDTTNGDLKYVRAIDTDGSDWGTPKVADSIGHVGEFSSLKMVNGRPAVSYFSRNNENLMYVRAVDNYGDSWGTPVTVDDGPDDAGLYTSLAVVEGRPAISYYVCEPDRDLRYVRANDDNGVNWGLPKTVDSAGDVGLYTSLAIVNGNPAISYLDTANANLKFVRATDITGSNWGTPVTVDNSAKMGLFTSLAVVNGKPAISYLNYSQYRLRWAYADDEDGATWSLRETVDTSTYSTNETSIADINGHPAISYYDQTNGDLKFAIYY